MNTLLRKLCVTLAVALALAACESPRDEAASPAPSAEASNTSPPPEAAPVDAPPAVSALLEHVPDDTHHLMVLDTSRAGDVRWRVLGAATPLPLEMYTLTETIHRLSSGTLDIVLDEVDWSPEIVVWTDPDSPDPWVLVHLPGTTADIAARTDQVLHGKRHLVSDIGWDILVLDEHVLALVPSARAEAFASASTAGTPLVDLTGLANADGLQPGQVAALFWVPSPESAAAAPSLEGYEDLGEKLDPEAAQMLGLVAPELTLRSLTGRIDRTDDEGVLWSWTAIAAPDQADGLAQTFAQPVLGLGADPARAERLQSVWAGATVEVEGDVVDLTVPVSAEQLDALNMR